MDNLFIYFGNFILQYVEVYFDLVGIGYLLGVFLVGELNILVVMCFCYEFGYCQLFGLLISQEVKCIDKYCFSDEYCGCLFGQ